MPITLSTLVSAVALTILRAVVFTALIAWLTYGVLYTLAGRKSPTPPRPSPERRDPLELQACRKPQPHTFRAGLMKRPQ